MPEGILDLAFGVNTLNDPAMTMKFGTLKYDQLASGLFLQKGRDLSSMVEKDVAKWREVTLSRKPAGITGKRSPAAVVEGVDDALKSCVLIDTRIATNPIPLDEITTKEAAQNFLATEGMDARKRLQIVKELVAWMTLKGAVSVSPTLIPGSKVTFSYTFGVTALAPLADWSNTGTKIATTELDARQTTYHDACGLEIKQALIDNLTRRYMKANTEVQALTNADPRPDKSGTVLGPDGETFHFEGIDWTPTRQKYDLSGTLTKYLGDKAMIALPGDDELNLVLAHAEGYGAIPKEALGFAESQMGIQAPNRGDYSYAYTSPNPATVTVVYGSRFLFILTFPEAVGYDDDVSTP